MISANPGDYPVINSGREPLGFINEWNTEEDPIGITSRGAGVGSITWQDGRYFRGNLNYSVTIKDTQKVRIRYLYHVLQKMQLEIQALCTYDGIPALNAGNLKELKVPVPSFAEQGRIEITLDKFDALTNSITEGLPREIELRQKQYEYYRDLLLSFPKPEEVAA
jgi:type I restriction enzyme S subunit